MLDREKSIDVISPCKEIIEKMVKQKGEIESAWYRIQIHKMLCDHYRILHEQGIINFEDRNYFLRRLMNGYLSLLHFLHDEDRNYAEMEVIAKWLYEDKLEQQQES